MGIMKEDTMQNMTKRLLIWAVVVALVLLVPLIAMQFRTEVNWTLFDFVFMGVLLFGAAVAYEVVARKMPNGMYRAAVGMAVTASVLLVWVNGAVGNIGDENHPANLLYFGVLALGFISALMTGFKPRGMARVMFTMAVAQLLVLIVALIFWNETVTAEPPGIVRVLLLNIIFALMFAGSGMVFRRVTGKQT